MSETEMKNWLRTVTACARRVYRALGCGFEPEIYIEALCRELDRAGVPYDTDLLLPVLYKGEEVGEQPFPLSFDKLAVATISTSARFSRAETTALENLLQFFNLQGGVLLHFGGSRLRVVQLANKAYKRYPFSLN